MSEFKIAQYTSINTNIFIYIINFFPHALWMFVMWVMWYNILIICQTRSYISLPFKYASKIVPSSLAEDNFSSLTVFCLCWGSRLFPTSYVYTGKSLLVNFDIASYVCYQRRFGVLYVVLFATFQNNGIVYSNKSILFCGECHLKLFMFSFLQLYILAQK